MSTIFSSCPRCERVFSYPKISFEITEEMQRQWNSRMHLDSRVKAVFDKRMQEPIVDQTIKFLEKYIFSQIGEDGFLFGRYNFIPHIALLNFFFRKISLTFLSNSELQVPSFFDERTLDVINSMRKSAFESKTVVEVQKILTTVYFSLDPSAYYPPTKDKSVERVFSHMTEVNHALYADKLIETAFVEIRKKYWDQGVEYFHARVSEFQKMILHNSLPPLDSSTFSLLQKGDRRAQNLVLMRILYLYTFGALRKTPLPLFFYDSRVDIWKIRETYNNEVAKATLAFLTSVQDFMVESKEPAVREYKGTLLALCQQKKPEQKQHPLECFLFHEMDFSESLSITEKLKKLFLSQPLKRTPTPISETSPLLTRRI